MEVNSILSFDEFPAYLHLRRSLPKYDSSTEKRQDHAWWRLDKTATDTMLKAFAQLITDLLKGSPTSDKELQYLLRTATDLSHVPRSAPTSVALLGAQGAGKSLTINAIFDCDGLSLTGAEGAACTSSIIKYVQYPKSSTGENKFFAEITFFTRAVSYTHL